MAHQDTVEWADEAAAEQQRRLRLTLLLSVVAHVLAVTALSLTPPPRPIRLPPAITVDLLAALPKAPEPAPAPPPEPVPPAAVPAPPPKPKVKLLPKEAPSVMAQPKPKPKPKPTPVEKIRSRPKPKELQYDDALAQLRQELGESAPVAPPPEVARAATPAATASSKGVRVPPEVAAWTLAVERHIRSVWITPPEFRESGLATELRVRVAADGRVVGEPEVVQSSGNPFYDDNAKRAIVKSSPLPAPPKPGVQTIIFTPEG